ncbi:helix-turn-helix domain-containing protein [Silvibacterium dinghuense]|uniref:XRE family transcriptional regulator n=1 Tax=Silvibacterium dinghuense TaxID=1560006 RepID=A0A4Q1SJV5_9BACT|nr:helix-turn-helix transcriptional regulator [Silvibacterium dinghuense]RXS97954.1 XRE family transcriptional regulator [Silvibacterium dinghuense]GGH03300.1 transcriptional regulator [Silvibacterium dinghuense]
MPPDSLTLQPEREPLGTLLRYWRGQRGRSQLDLSLDAGVSQRHISFIESGRSAPSRDLLLVLARALDIPLREQNELLLAAGYAPVFLESSWDAPEMASVLRAVDRMLQQHKPHPALLMDRYWNVLRTNDAAPRFFGSLTDLSHYPKPRNLLRLMFDPEALRPYVENWEQAAAALLDRVQREVVGHVVDQKTVALLESLHAYPGVRELKTLRSHLPVVPLTFRKGGERWSYFSLITIVGAPNIVPAQELKVECMFPL